MWGEPEGLGGIAVSISELDVLKYLKDGPKTFEEVSYNFGFYWGMVSDVLQNLLDEGKLLFDPKTELFYSNYGDYVGQKLVEVRAAVHFELRTPMTPEELYFLFPTDQSVLVASALDHLCRSGAVQIWGDGRVCVFSENVWVVLN